MARSFGKSRSNKVQNTDLFTAAANEHYRKHIKTKSKQALEFIDKNVDWNELLAPISMRLEQLSDKKSEAGRKAFSLEVIVKCMLLQHIYGLSDPRLEEEIADRRSFQIFLGLNSGDSIPDETTICKYRSLFSKLKIDKMLFNSFNAQLKKKQIILGKGTIVDATIKQAQATSYSKRDDDADHTQKRGKWYYGYKGHIAIDEESEVIKEVEFTSASVHDSTMFDSLVDYTEEAVYADKGYANTKRRKKLEDHNIFDGILEKGYRNKPLTKSAIKLNKILSGVRNRVERPFAYMKRILGYARCRYYDIGRNRFEFVLKAIIYNMRRMITLTA